MSTNRERPERIRAHDPTRYEKMNGMSFGEIRDAMRAKISGLGPVVDLSKITFGEISVQKNMLSGYKAKKTESVSVFAVEYGANQVGTNASKLTYVETEKDNSHVQDIITLTDVIYGIQNGLASNFTEQDVRDHRDTIDSETIEKKSADETTKGDLDDVRSNLFPALPNTIAKYDRELLTSLAKQFQTAEGLRLYKQITTMMEALNTYSANTSASLSLPESALTLGDIGDLEGMKPIINTLYINMRDLAERKGNPNSIKNKIRNELKRINSNMPNKFGKNADYIAGLMTAGHISQDQEVRLVDLMFKHAASPDSLGELSFIDYIEENYKDKGSIDPTNQYYGVPSYSGATTSRSGGTSTYKGDNLTPGGAGTMLGEFASYRWDGERLRVDENPMEKGFAKMLLDYKTGVFNGDEHMLRLVETNIIDQTLASLAGKKNIDPVTGRAIKGEDGGLSMLAHDGETGREVFWEILQRRYITNGFQASLNTRFSNDHDAYIAAGSDMSKAENISTVQYLRSSSSVKDQLLVNAFIATMMEHHGNDNTSKVIGNRAAMTAAMNSLGVEASDKTTDLSGVAGNIKSTLSDDIVLGKPTFGEAVWAAGIDDFGGAQVDKRIAAGYLSPNAGSAIKNVGNIATQVLNIGTSALALFNITKAGFKAIAGTYKWITGDDSYAASFKDSGKSLGKAGLFYGANQGLQMAMDPQQYFDDIKNGKNVLLSGLYAITEKGKAENVFRNEAARNRVISQLDLKSVFDDKLGSMSVNDLLSGGKSAILKPGVGDADGDGDVDAIVFDRQALQKIAPQSKVAGRDVGKEGLKSYAKAMEYYVTHTLGLQYSELKAMMGTVQGSMSLNDIIAERGGVTTKMRENEAEYRRIASEIPGMGIDEVKDKLEGLDDAERLKTVELLKTIGWAKSKIVKGAITSAAVSNINFLGEGSSVGVAKDNPEQFDDALDNIKGGTSNVSARTQLNTILDNLMKIDMSHNDPTAIDSKINNERQKYAKTLAAVYGIRGDLLAGDRGTFSTINVTDSKTGLAVERKTRGDNPGSSMQGMQWYFTDFVGPGHPAGANEQMDMAKFVINSLRDSNVRTQSELDSMSSRDEVYK